MFDKIGFVIGYLKLLIYKVCYGSRFQFSWHIRFMPSSKIRIGKNSKIILGPNFRTRYNVLLKANDNAEIIIGENVFINDNSSLVCRDRIQIGKDTVIASGVMIYDHNHIYGKDIKVANSGFISNKIKIGDNVWIGLNAVILAGTIIGDNTVVAASTIVKECFNGNELIYNKKNKCEKMFDDVMR